MSDNAHRPHGRNGIQQNRLPTKEMMISEQPAKRLQQEFQNVSELIEYISSGAKMPEFRGIGSNTARKVYDWLESEHPTGYQR